MAPFLKIVKCSAAEPAAEGVGGVEGKPALALEGALDGPADLTVGELLDGPARKPSVGGGPDDPVAGMGDEMGPGLLERVEARGRGTRGGGRLGGGRGPGACACVGRSLGGLCRRRLGRGGLRRRSRRGRGCGDRSLLPGVPGHLLHLLEPLLDERGIPDRLDTAAVVLEREPADPLGVVPLDRLVVEVVVRGPESSPVIVHRLMTGKFPFGGSMVASAWSKKSPRWTLRTCEIAASSDSNGRPSGTEMATGGPGWGAAAGSVGSGPRRATTTVKRSGLARTVRAISKSSIVRQDARTVLTSAVKLASSG